jgi:hypothetical protein
MPATVRSAAVPFHPIVTTDGKGKSKEAAIDLVESDEESSSEDERSMLREPESSLIYGAEEVQGYPPLYNESDADDSSATVLE